MRAAEILPKLEAWAMRLKESDAQVDALHAIVGTCGSSPLIDAIWRLQDGYTNAVASLVGDQFEWLHYYRNECAMGAKPRTIASLGGREMKLRTIKQLAKLIAETQP